MRFRKKNHWIRNSAIVEKALGDDAICTVECLRELQGQDIRLEGENVITYDIEGNVWVFTLSHTLVHLAICILILDQTGKRYSSSFPLRISGSNAANLFVHGTCGVLAPYHPLGLIDANKDHRRLYRTITFPSRSETCAQIFVLSTCLCPQFCYRV